MWALRRASLRFKNRGLSSPAAKIICVNSVIGTAFSQNHNITTNEPQGKLFDESSPLTRFYNTSLSSSKFHTTVCAFSSQAGADEEDPFSELRVIIQNKDESISEAELDSSGSVGKSPKDAGVSDMTKAILDAPTSVARKVMDKWVREGNEVTQVEASLTMIHLRRRKLFVKALKLSEWLEATKRLEFSESHYAARIDLIARTRGIAKAEEYLKSIPESFRGELVYRILLANCVSVTNTKKSEEVFDKMKDLGLLTTCSTFNQMLLLYQKVDREKIADILLLMEKENINPSLLTYHILINVKGLNNDINGMEQIVETIKSEGLEPSLDVKVSLVRHYAAAGLKDKAVAVSREIEDDDLGKRRHVCKLLLPIYASLGNEEDVERIWKFCESNARLAEYAAAIEAWGLLGKIDKAEGAFEKMMQIVKKPSSKHYTSMLKVYANHKMSSKRKDLTRRMVESGLRKSKEAISRLIIINATKC